MGQYSKEAIMEGVRLVTEMGQKVKPTARELGLNYKTLGRYIKKHTEMNQTIGWSGDHKRILTDQQEQVLADYLLQASRIYFGLTMHEFRSLTFEFAIKNSIKIPTSWQHNELAGKEWAHSFMKRHPVFSLRTPEPTSLARMSSFNKHNVGLFYDNLENVIEQYHFTPDRIFNCDETGVTTVQRPVKRIAEKGVKRVGAAVSQEKGILVTMCGTISAIGNSLPPFCVFPRVNTQPLWEDVLPVGSKAEGHAKASGWMTEDNFLSYLKHFEKYARPSPEFPVLLLLDNHASHVSLAGINFCREKNIVLLSFPPHCSHELQPLDKTVYGPFKAFFNQAADIWMRDPLNAGKVMTIHNLPVLIAKAFPKAFTPINIKSGFEATGIQPFNRDRIPEHRYMPGFVTDQPAPPTEITPTTSSSAEMPSTSSSTLPPTIPVFPSATASCSTATASCSAATASCSASTPSCSTDTPTSSSASPKVISPHDIRPFAKAAPRKGSTKKKMTSMVLTSTPVKRSLQETAEKRGIKRVKVPKCRQSIFSKPTRPSQPFSDSESDTEQMSLHDDSDSSLSMSDVEQDNDEIKNPTAQQLDEGDFILVKFATKKTVSHYLGKIESVDVDDDTVDCMFLKRKPTKDGQFLFVFPDVLDASEVSVGDILCKVNPPTTGGTARTGDIFTFCSDFVNSFNHPIM